MEKDMMALIIVELAAGIIIGFAAWTFVQPVLVGANPPTA